MENIKKRIFIDYLDNTRVLDNVLKCCVFESDYCETTLIDDFVKKYPEKYQFLIGNKSKNEEVMFQGRYSGIGDTYTQLQNCNHTNSCLLNKLP